MLVCTRNGASRSTVVIAQGVPILWACAQGRETQCLPRGRGHIGKTKGHVASKGMTDEETKGASESLIAMIEEEAKLTTEREHSDLVTQL